MKKTSHTIHIWMVSHLCEFFYVPLILMLWEISFHNWHIHDSFHQYVAFYVLINFKTVWKFYLKMNKQTIFLQYGLFNVPLKYNFFWISYGILYTRMVFHLSESIYVFQDYLFEKISFCIFYIWKVVHRYELSHE